MDSLLDILARNLRHYRGTLSQKELADRAGVGIIIVQRIEQKRVWPELKNVEAIARALGIEAADLFYKGEPPKPIVSRPSVFEVVEIIQDALQLQLGTIDECRENPDRHLRYGSDQRPLASWADITEVAFTEAPTPEQLQALESAGLPAEQRERLRKLGRGEDDDALRALQKANRPSRTPRTKKR